jgi:hypothetical protein
MGKLTVDGPDLADRSLEALLAAAGAVTPWFRAEGTFNFSLWGGGVGSVILERTFDGGATPIPLSNLGAVVSFVGPSSETIFNREAGVLVRARFLTRTSGSFTARFSQ